MLNSPLISDLIFKGDVSGIKEIMKRSRELGMQTFDQSLFDLYEGGLISYEDALRNADSINDLRLQIKLHGKEAKDRNVFSGIGNLDVVPDAPTRTQHVVAARCCTLARPHVSVTATGLDAIAPTNIPARVLEIAFADGSRSGCLRVHRASTRRRPRSAARPRPGALQVGKRDVGSRRSRRSATTRSGRRSPTATTPASTPDGISCYDLGSARALVARYLERLQAQPRDQVTRRDP